MTKMIDVDMHKYTRLKREYNIALENKKETVVIDGDEYVVGYLKYLIEYLKPKFENN